MNVASPIINFNGAFLVESLEVGSLMISSKRVSAVKILLQQTLSYSVLARGQTAAEIYAYCFEAHRTGRRKLEAHAPCYLVADEQNGSLEAVIASITWYISPALRKKCIAQVASILGGDVLGDETYPLFQGKPFAVFTTE